MSYRARTYRPGDRILARDETEISAEVARLGQLQGSTGIGVRNGTLALDLPERIYIKLTSTANANGAYAWKEVLPAALGTWVDSGRVGSQSGDPCYERGTRNASLTVDGKVYQAIRAETTGEWIFE